MDNDKRNLQLLFLVPIGVFSYVAIRTWMEVWNGEAPIWVAVLVTIATFALITAPFCVEE